MLLCGGQSQRRNRGQRKAGIKRTIQQCFVSPGVLLESKAPSNPLPLSRPPLAVGAHLANGAGFKVRIWTVWRGILLDLS